MQSQADERRHLEDRQDLAADIGRAYAMESHKTPSVITDAEVATAAPEWEHPKDPDRTLAPELTPRPPARQAGIPTIAAVPRLR